MVQNKPNKIKELERCSFYLLSFTSIKFAPSNFFTKSWDQLNQEAGGVIFCHSLVRGYLNNVSTADCPQILPSTL